MAWRSTFAKRSFANAEDIIPGAVIHGPAGSEIPLKTYAGFVFLPVGVGCNTPGCGRAGMIKNDGEVSYLLCGMGGVGIAEILPISIDDVIFLRAKSPRGLGDK